MVLNVTASNAVPLNKIFVCVIDAYIKTNYFEKIRNRFLNGPSKRRLKYRNSARNIYPIKKPYNYLPFLIFL